MTTEPGLDVRRSVAGSLPAFLVCADATLMEMARRKPTTLAALRAVPGMGDAKVQKYGEAFLAVFRG